MGLNVLGIIKILAYQKGIFVPDELYDELSKSAYNGFRTTSGIFMKFGGTMTIEEFENSPMSDNITYEEYLKNREWATTQVYKVSELTEEMKLGSYLTLDIDDKGDFGLIGYYVDKNGNQYKLKTNDVGVFKQGSYNDKEAVAVQAGGIRSRVSPCGTNCISGCSFCTFGTGADKYQRGRFTRGFLDEYLKPLIRRVVNENGITQLFFTGGNPSLEDLEAWTVCIEEGIETFKEENVKNGVDEDVLTVDVMLTPRGIDAYAYDDREIRRFKYREYCELLKNMGVTTVSPNMELWSEEKLNLYCPSRGDGTTKSDIGQEGYLDFLEEAVETFGAFKVRTSLIVGLNSIEETKEAIDELIRRGVYVTLSPYKQPESIQQNPRHKAVASVNEPKEEDLIVLSEYLRISINRYLASLPEQKRKEYEASIDLSLNSHNTHNTANLCSGRDLDRLEKKHLELGRDNSLVCNYKELLLSVKR